MFLLSNIFGNIYVLGLKYFLLGKRAFYVSSKADVLPQA